MSRMSGEDRAIERSSDRHQERTGDFSPRNRVITKHPSRFVLFETIGVLRTSDSTWSRLSERKEKGETFSVFFLLRKSENAK